METIAQSVVTSTSLSTLAATNETQFKAIKAAPNQDITKTSLLSVLQAMDGNKSARADVALTALHSAYTLAIKSGNVSQIADVIGSTGKKVCEKAMRTALQQTGVGFVDGNVSGKGLATKSKKSASDNCESLDEYIDRMSMLALDIFVSIACKETVKKEKVITEAEAEAKANAFFKNAEEKVAEQKAKNQPVELSSEQLTVKLLALISTGALDEDQIDRIETALLASRVPAVPAQSVEMVLQ